MVFYKGAVSWTDLQTMPLDKVMELNEHANKILEEVKKK